MMPPWLELGHMSILSQSLKALYFWSRLGGWAPEQSGGSVRKEGRKEEGRRRKEEGRRGTRGWEGNHGAQCADGLQTTRQDTPPAAS